MKLNKSVIDKSNKIISLEIAGRIKSGYLSAIESELNNLSNDVPVFLILNLTAIEAIDSMGIGLLIKTRTDIVQAGGNVVLMAGTRVQNIIRLSGLENYFKMATTQEDALELLKQLPEPAAPSDTPEPPDEDPQNEST